jgi:hypothetical protein
MGGGSGLTTTQLDAGIAAASLSTLSTGDLDDALAAGISTLSTGDLDGALTAWDKTGFALTTAQHDAIGGRANMIMVGGSTAAADGLKDFATAGYDTGNNVAQADVIFVGGVSQTTISDLGTAELDAAIAGLSTVSTGDLDAVALTTGDLDAAIADAGLSTLDTGDLITATDVNSQVLDVLNVDTFGEPGQEAPAVSQTLSKKIGYLYKFMRNKIETVSTEIRVYNDAGAVVDQKSVVSDDGTTYTRGEFGSGP